MRILPSFALGCALVLAALLAPPHSHAEEIRDYYAEPGINPFKDSINQHFNEHIDPFSGTLQLKYTDLFIPGNGGMDIRVNRVYTSLQTNQYPTLGLNGLGWTMHFGRIVTSRNHADKLCNAGAFPLTTIENPSLEMPDGGRELLVLDDIARSTSNPSALITRSNWRAVCLPAGSVGMLVTSPDGTRYTMSQYDSFQGEPSWLTTRIEDLQGNWIRLEYKTNAVGVSYIDKIFRSEEGGTTPVVTYEYESETTADIKLAAISANGQRVTYRYEVIPGFLFPYYKQLAEVRRPDGRSWGYAYNPKLGDPDPDDDVLEDGLASFSLIHVDYPYGANIDYTYQRIRFDPGSSLPTTSIHTKTVSGTGVTGGAWTYAFAPFSFPYADSHGGTLRWDVTTVTGPEDIQKFYHHGKDFRAAGPTGGNIFIPPSYVGTLARKETYSRANALLERSEYAWGDRKISNEDFWHGAGYRSWWRENGTYVPVMLGEYTDRDNAAGTAGYRHYVLYSDHDFYGNAGRVFEGSALLDHPSRQRVLSYFIDTTKWILHRVEDETWQEVGHDGSIRSVGEVERTYDANGKLLEEVKFGVSTEYTYTPQGDVRSVEDARGKVRRYSNYRRGIAQREEWPEGIIVTRDVNDTGTVHSETNGRGFTTSFDYDDLNRLTAIDFPIKGDVTIAYGSASEGYRRTLSRANSRQVEVINDFGQVLRIERQDAASGQMIYRTSRFDASGRETFTSYPNATIGVTTTYDALGRVRRTQHPDSTGVDYDFDDLDAVVTNERGYTTNYRYHIRGVDFANQVLAHINQQISQTQRVGTILRRDIFGNAALVFQGEQTSDGNVRGFGRQYQYDSRFFLTRVIEPEVGATVYSHDAVGNVLSERVNDADAIRFVYDDLNRRTLTDFPGATPDVRVIYDDNGNQTEVSKGKTRWVYGYDENDNLTSETLTVTDTPLGARTYVTQHAYNNQDVLERITYPSGLAVNYAPDGFGRATQAGTFATNITYHPSGPLQSYRLANGVVTDVTLNQRLLTRSIQAGGLVSLGYTYDVGSNVMSITDGIDSSKSVTMSSGSYDGLDRLLSASGSWGAASFSYDFHGNMLTKRVGTDNLSTVLDDQRRVYQVRKLNASNTSLEDARIRMDFDTRGNAVAKRRYQFDSVRNVTSMSDLQFDYDSDSTLIKARLATRTPDQFAPVVEKSYVYDGNGQRSLEKKRRSYDLRYSVYSRTGDLLFEDSIADCTRTDYIRLGALSIARSDDQQANPAADTDGDGINDCAEVQLGLNPNNAADANLDSDGDGLTNLQEFLAGTSPHSGDTDGDGLSDFRELDELQTDPTSADSDGDGIADGDEAADPSLNPRLADADHDGVTDYWELQLDTDPLDPLDGRIDTDGDGFSNRQESLLGYDPLSALKTPQRGMRAWSTETLGKIFAPTAIGPTGVLYVTAEYDHLYAINPDGTHRWRYSVPDALLSPAAVGPDGTIYLRASLANFDEIHAVNPNGTERWVYSTDYFVGDGVAIGPNGRVYFAAYAIFWNGSANVYASKWEALDDTGTAVAGGQFGQSGATHVPAVGIDGTVYVVSNNGTLFAFSGQGTQLWSLPFGTSSGHSPVLDGAQRIYVSNSTGRTIAVSPQGQALWARQAPDNVTRSSVVVGNGVLYIGAHNSRLYAVNPANGATNWEASTYGTSYTPAVARDGTIYVTSFGGSLSAYSPTGTLLWIHKVDIEVSAAPAIDRDGTVYFGTRAGQVVAVADNSGGLGLTPWPMYRHDAAGTSYICFDGIDDCAGLGIGLNLFSPSERSAKATDGSGIYVRSRP